MTDRYMQVKQTANNVALRGQIGVVYEEQGDTLTLVFGYLARTAVVLSLTEVEEWALTIEEGNKQGVHFSQHKLNEVRKLAVEIGRMQPTATNFKLWYDPEQDYHCLGFDLKGHHYEVRYYKVYCITKDNRDNFLLEKNFYVRDWDIVQFFARDKQEEWDVSVGIYDIFSATNRWIGTVYARSFQGAEEQAVVLSHAEPFTINCALEPL